MERSINNDSLLAGSIIGSLSFGGYNGSFTTRGWNGGAEILATAFENWDNGQHGSNLIFYATTPGQAFPNASLIVTGFSLVPGIDNALSFGGNGARWSSIWSATGLIQTSDERDKTDMQQLEPHTAGKLLDKINPILFRWKTGENIVETEAPSEGKHPQNTGPSVKLKAKPGKRLHAGFLAQEVKQALTDMDLDFGVWGVEDQADDDSRQWLRPDQMIPILWAALQETREELQELQKSPVQ